MKLVSLNVAIFEANNKLIKEFLAKQNADILCLQEVTKRIDKSANSSYVSKGWIDQAANTSKYEYFEPITFLKNFCVDNFHQKEHFDFNFGGFIEMGNYIKTKFRIIKKENIFVKGIGGAKIVDWGKWPKCLTNAVQIADLRLSKSKKLRVLNYHGIWSRKKLGNEETLNACKTILNKAKEVNYPTIIAGDFNLFPDSPSMQVFYKDYISLVDTYKVLTTRPKNNELSHMERNVVDYILVSKDIKVEFFSVINSTVSDHLPLVLDFKI